MRSSHRYRPMFRIYIAKIFYFQQAAIERLVWVKTGDISNKKFPYREIAQSCTYAGWLTFSLKNHHYLIYSHKS